MNFRGFHKKKKKKRKKIKFTSALQKLPSRHAAVMWFHIKEIWQKCVHLFFNSRRHEKTLRERINNADASFALCKGIHSIWGVIEKPQCPGFRALLHGTASGFFISDGYLGADMETDRISEPRMIQGSPLKINRQTVLHSSRLFISASLCARPAISAQSPARKVRTHTHTHTHRGHYFQTQKGKKEDIMHIKNTEPLHIYQRSFCWFSCRDHTYILYLWLQLGGDRSWILHFDSFVNTGAWFSDAADVMFFVFQCFSLNQINSTGLTVFCTRGSQRGSRQPLEGLHDGSKGFRWFTKQEIGK